MKQKEIQRLLIANRGEIAVRVIRTCKEMGITTVAVYSDVDRTALHVQLAHEAYPLGGSTASESYLNQRKILEIARKAKVDAIHPGYGFLSENPLFADNVAQEGLIFVGPRGNAIRAMGDKTEARKKAQELGVPIVPGTKDPLEDANEAIKIAESMGFPILLKAAAGGGGKGMRLVASGSDLPSALRGARSEAMSAFGDDRVYLEKYIENPRHIEIQILADQYGNTVYFGERECSIQRRHQKVIEESPSPIVEEAMRVRMGQSAAALAKSAGYSNAGTIEFIVDQRGNFYFLEMNTRLQVEHPVTEMITGIDLVREQIRIAEGKKLSVNQEGIKTNGHAIECRVYAEDPESDFFPSTGVLKRYLPPEGPRVRVDNGFRAGDRIEIYYDPMLSKVITWGLHRKDAIDAMKRSLSEFQVEGVKTTIPFCQFVLSHPKFLEGDFNTHFVERYFRSEDLRSQSSGKLLAAAVLAVALKKTSSNDGTVVQSKEDQANWKRRRIETYRS